MNSNLIITAFIFIFFNLVACVDTAVKPSTNASNLTEAQKTAATPDAGDLLELLQGKWQSEQDPTYQIEFVDSLLRHINGGKLTIESGVTVDGNCASSICEAAANSPEGWCFQEKAGEDTQCNLVLQCTHDTLRYRALGAAGGDLIFKKK